jgi:hypothetical protein
MLCGWCAVYSYIYSLVDPDDISIHWANVLNVMEDGNAEEDEGKDPNEQKQEEGDQEGTVSKLVSGLCCDDVSTKLTLVISHRVLLPSHSRRHLLHNRHVGRLRRSVALLRWRVALLRRRFALLRRGVRRFCLIRWRFLGHSSLVFFPG